MQSLKSTGSLPNLIIIGAMKSGTTSLHHYLSLHPEVFMSRQKELNFFIEERNWCQGTQWYRSHFDSNFQVYGETSPNYTTFPQWKGIPRRMHSLIPGVKLIYLVRDPVERIISHYLHFYAVNKENRTVEEALSTFQNNPYIDRSRYYFQIEQFLEFFPEKSIQVITSEELSNFPKETMKKVFSFLGIDNDFELKPGIQNLSHILKFGSAILRPDFKYDKKLHQTNLKRRKLLSEDHFVNKTFDVILDKLPLELKFHVEKIIYWPISQKVEKPNIDNSLRFRIIDYLQEDIESLKAFTGRNFEEWKIYRKY